MKFICFCCVFFNFLLAFNFQLLVSDVHPSDIVAKTFILRILFFPNFKTLERIGKKRRRWGCLRRNGGQGWGRHPLFLHKSILFAGSHAVTLE